MVRQIPLDGTCVLLEAVGKAAACPACSVLGRLVHDRYRRRPAASRQARILASGAGQPPSPYIPWPIGSSPIQRSSAGSLASW